LGLPSLRSGDPGFGRRFNPKPNPSCGRIFGFCFSLTILKPWDCRRCAPAIQVLGGDSIQSQILPAVGFSAFAFPLPSSSLGIAVAALRRSRFWEEIQSKAKSFLRSDFRLLLFPYHPQALGWTEKAKAISHSEMALNCRGDWIRTSDLTPPRRVR